MENKCGDSLSVEYRNPTEGGGSIPTSPLQFTIVEIPVKQAVIFNGMWHSRLPELKNSFSCKVAYAAIYDNRCYAVGIWGHPVARSFNHKPVLELRRMAICQDAPKNTASRMLTIMIKLLKVKFPTLQKVISYQDTAVHTGTIYKASGWYIGRITKAKEIRWGILNKDGSGRKRNPIVTKSDKIRWERDV